jgi:hypothetical protein
MPHSAASIVARAPDMIESIMTAVSRHSACGSPHQVVLDDYRRLPGRFFGRFTTSIATAPAGSFRAI